MPGELPWGSLCQCQGPEKRVTYAWDTKAAGHLATLPQRACLQLSKRR